MPALDFRIVTNSAARRAGRWIVASSAILLSGCASFSPDGGMALVTSTVSRDLGKDAAALRTPEETASARSVTARLLAKPLSVDAAVQIALLNNRGLQAAYNEITANIPYPIRFAMPFEEYIDYSEKNPESGSTKIYIPIKL